MAERAQLDVVIDPSGAQKGASGVNAAIRSISESWIGTIAKLYAAERAFETVWNAAKKGAEVEEGFIRLNRQAGLYGTTARQLVQDVERMTQGQLSHANAINVSSRALQQGLNPDQLNRLAAAGETLSDVWGGTIVDSMEDLLKAVGSGSARLLTARGIYVDLEKEVLKYANAQGKTVEQLTKQEKAQVNANAILKETDEIVKKLSTQQLSDIDKLQKLEAQWDNFTLAVQRHGQALLLDGVEKFKQYANAVDKFFDKYLSFIPGGKITGIFESDSLPKDLGIDKTLQGMKKEPAPGPDPKMRLAEIDAALNKERTLIEGSYEVRRSLNDAEMEREAHNLRAKLDMQVEAVAIQKDMADDAYAADLQRIDQLQAAEETAIKAIRDVEGIGIQERDELIKKHEQAIYELLAKRNVAYATHNAAVLKADEALYDAQRAEADEERDWLYNHRAEQINNEIAQRKKGYDDELALAEQYARLTKTNMHLGVPGGQQVSHTTGYYASQETQMRADMGVLEARLARETELTLESSQRLIGALQADDEEYADQILMATFKTEEEKKRIKIQYALDAHEVTMQYANDAMAFFEGLDSSMRKYVGDKSMLGLGVDQARRIAQGMEQAFGKFFFDAIEGRIMSLEDAMTGVLDFMKQLVSQLMAQLVTTMAIKAVMGGFGGGFFGSTPGVGGAMPSLAGPSGMDTGAMVGLPGMGLTAYASGGIARHPQFATVAESGPEAIIPLMGGAVPVKMMGGGGGVAVSVPVSVNIVNQASQADVQTQQRQGANGMQEIDILITNKMNKAIQDGSMDPALRNRHNIKPALVRR